MRSKLFSIVTTLYRSENFIAEFYQRIVKTAESITADFELIFVNDGSPDNSAAFIRELIQKDDRVILIDLSRNFGHHHAIMAGLEQSQGEFVFLIDIDLEESPEWLSDFYSDLQQRQCDVVFGVQERRKGSRFESASGSWFYTLFNKLSPTHITPNLCTVRLMTRQYVNAVIQMKEKNIFLAGIFSWVGFHQCAKIVKKGSRETPSTYTLSKKFSLLENAISSFSAKPLYIIFYLGIFMSITSFSVGLAVIIKKIVSDQETLIGWASTMISLWFLGGCIIMIIGGVGLYIGKIFLEVKNRPTFIIRSIEKKVKE